MARNKGVALPAPGTATAPKYWMHEIGGELAPAIERLVRAEPLSDRDILQIRAYLWQWIESPVWDQNPHLGAAGAAELVLLRAGVGKLRTAGDIRDWVAVAVDWGMDPL